MSILTKEKIKEIIDNTNSGNLKWSKSTDNGLFIASDDDVKLAVRYDTKTHCIGPTLSMGISSIKEKHESETLVLINNEDARWEFIYKLWVSITDILTDKSAA